VLFAREGAKVLADLNLDAAFEGFPTSHMQ
jgi:hypothetical protein